MKTISAHTVLVGFAAVLAVGILSEKSLAATRREWRFDKVNSSISPSQTNFTPVHPLVKKGTLIDFDNGDQPQWPELVIKGFDTFKKSPTLSAPGVLLKSYLTVTTKPTHLTNRDLKANCLTMGTSSDGLVVEQTVVGEGPSVKGPSTRRVTVKPSNPNLTFNVCPATVGFFSFDLPAYGGFPARKYTIYLDATQTVGPPVVVP